MACCVVELSVVIENSNARCRKTSPCTLLCQDSWRVDWNRFPLWEINMLLEDGRLDVNIHLQIYKPITFRNLSLTGAYSFCAPVNCVYVIGEAKGTVYVLLNLAQISPDIQEWCIYSFRVFNPQQGITLAGFPVQPKAFLDGWLLQEEHKIVITHADYEEKRIRVDIVCVDEHPLETRSYAIPDTDQDLKWSVWWDEHKCFGVASGVLDSIAYHHFWVLQDNGGMELVANLEQTSMLGFPEAAKVAKGHFYAIVTTSPECKNLFVSSFDQPDVWQQFGLSPYLFNTGRFIATNMSQDWRHLIVIATVKNTLLESVRTVMFSLRIEGVSDCYVEPYIVLPKGMPKKPKRYKVEDDNLICSSKLRPDGDEVISTIPIQPQPLKTESVAAVERLMDGRGRRDGMGILVWEQNWRQQLIQKLGNSITNYLW